MFHVLEHFEISEACFRDDFDNRDACLSLDLSTLPHSYGKSLIRVVMDGITNGDGGAAVKIAARVLLHHLAAGLLDRHLTIADQIETMAAGGADSQEIKSYLEEQIFGIIRQALATADDALCHSPHPEPYCTVSIAVVFHRYIFTANMGDSPIYLVDLREDNLSLKPLFTCHNAAGMQMEQGEITEEEALHSEYSNALRVFLGCREYDLLREVSCMSEPLPQSALLVLGSDGALAQVLRQEMADAIAEYHTEGLEAIHQELQLLVKESGSVDDYTLVMDRIESD